jgi:hypothetical protein
MLCGRARQLVLQRQRASGGRDSLDVDRPCPFRVLENLPNQSVGAECRCSLAGVIYVTRLFAGAYFLVLCQRGQMPCGFARPAGWGDGIGAVLRWLWLTRCALNLRRSFSYLKHAWTYRHYFCCLQRAPVWFKRLAGDTPASGTST